MSTFQFDKNSSVNAASARKRTLPAYLLLVVVAIYAVVSLYFIFETRSRLAVQQVSSEKLGYRLDLLETRQSVTESNFKASSDAVAQRLGMSERDLQQRIQARAAELQRQQQTVAKRQHEQEKISEVSGEMANVRTELGGAKTDIAATRTDLESTKAKLERAIGDLTGQGTLIARTGKN